MKTRRFIFTAFIALLSLNAFMQDYLDSYLEMAAKNNAALKSKFNEYLAALEVVPQLRALPDPQVAFGYFILPVETRMGPQEFKFSASQMFPWFGTLGARADEATRMAEAKYQAFEDAKSDLFNEIRDAYYNLYFTQQAIDITRNNLDILNTFRNLVLVKVEAGLVSAVDEYRLEIEIGDQENQLALLKDNLDVQTTAFNNLLNTGTSHAVELPEILQTTVLTEDKNALLDSIHSGNHKLLALDRQIESLEYRQESARKSGLPGFSVGLEYMMIGKGENNMAGKDAFVFPTVGITIPLYRNKYRAMVDEAIYMETARQEEKIDRTNLIETIFENTWRDLKDAGRRLDLNREQLILARKSVEILQVDYATNNANFEEVLGMERQVLKYTLETEKARADHEAAVSFIKYLMGN
jgi:cobalt-zinc-cadmium efflux system outer membrane protein